MSPDPVSKLYKLRKEDIVKAGAVLADAFQDDPVWQKVFEVDPNTKSKTHFMFETPVRHCLKYGEVYATSENLEGIAAWVPGRCADMTPWRILRSGAFRSAIKIGAKIAKMMKPVFAPLEKDRKAHMKDKEYVYLSIIGVAYQQQGQGHGGILLRALLEWSDTNGIDVYLETETEGNVEMYKRFGFTVVKEIILPQIELPMWEMIRLANPS